MKRRPLQTRIFRDKTQHLHQAQTHALRSYEAGDAGPLVSLSHKLLASNPHNLWAILHYGVYLMKTGHLDQAVNLFEQGHRRHPDDPNLHANLAAAYFELGRIQEALQMGERAVVLDPNNTHAWINLSTVLNKLGRCSEAEAAARNALTGPVATHGWNCLGNALKNQGRLREAIEVRYKVLDLDPDFPAGHTNLLLDLLYDGEATTEEISRAAKRISERIEAPFRLRWPQHTNTPAPWRPLRVGFISPDFCLHAVMYFAEIPLARLDRSQYEVYCYSTKRSTDMVAQRAHRFADHWQDLAGRTPGQQKAAILADGIDVLIDLAGHTGNSSIPTLARKPAPVQMSWLGYPGTTGLDSMDWLISDSITIPKGEDHLFSEQLVRLPPPFCAYRPLIREPILRHWPAYQVKPAPAIENGYVTFGCCNNLAKLTPNTLKAWSELMRRLPDARLLIEGPGLNTPEAMSEYRQHLLDHGIPEERLKLINREGKNQYLTYHSIDIALDPFPLTGGTTSFDLLWMGVPLVTMEGSGIRERLSSTILTALDREEWIAHNVDEYLTIAEQLANDTNRLNVDRMQQRLRVERSPLMDEIAFAGIFGEAIRHAWLNFCAKKQVGDDITTQARQVEDWLNHRPAMQAATPLVYLAEGERITLSEARQRILAAVEVKDWPMVRHLGLLTIESISKEPLALMALAEMEYATGNLTAARVFASHAIEEAPEMDDWYQRLADWHLEAGNEKEALRVLQVLASRLATTFQAS